MPNVDDSGQRLEPCAGKLARTVLRGGRGSNAAFLPDNLIRGGQLGRTANNRNTRTRAVNGIGQNVQLNQALWTLAEKMKELKAA